MRPLFDDRWYLATYPDVAAAGADPFRHFVEHGAAEGRDPNPLFDTLWYLQRNPDLELNPLEDYARRYGTSGCDPNPFFDSVWYLETNPDVAAEGLNPLEHYLSCGASEGRNPHPLFHSFWYAEQNAGTAGMNPLEHYLRWGAPGGISPHPLFDPVWYSGQAADLGERAMSPLQHYLERGAASGHDPHPLFSTAWYLASNPDIAAADINPLEHYLRHGARDGRDPHPLFSSRWYLEQNPDVAALSMMPFLHFVLNGEREARSPHPLFDARFYLAQQPNPEVSGRAPLQHYLAAGWRRGFKPHPDFNPAFYLREYYDVRESGAEPLTHFVTSGRAAGRRPHAPAENATGHEALPQAKISVPAPPVQEAIEIEPLPDEVKLAVSVLFYHREDLVPGFLRALLQQIGGARRHASFIPELYLSFNYQPSAELRREIEEVLKELLPEQREAVHLVERGWNLGFGAGHNEILRRADCDLFVMLNSDVVVQSDDWLWRITERFRESNIALVGLETNAARLRADGCGIPIRDGQEFDFVDGSLLAIRADLAARFGLFSAGFDYFYFEDADLCLRYRQMGLAIGRIDLPHQHNRSASSRLLPQSAVANVLNRNRGRFLARWGNYLETRQLPNRLAVSFREADRQLQCASLPALLALLDEHPTAILDLAGIHQQLDGLFHHPRIRLIPSWQSFERADYARFYEIEQSTSSEETRAVEVANSFGCAPAFDAARQHLLALVVNNPSQPKHGRREAMIYSPRVAPLFAGREPGARDWAALEAPLSARGFRIAFYAELATFELDEIEEFSGRDTHCAATASALQLLQSIARADLVVSSDHWVTELSQLIGVKTFVWLGAISPTRVVWNFEQAGFFHDRALPCLGCYHRYGEHQRNTCLRGDVACMRGSLVADFAQALGDFLDGTRATAAEITTPHLRESAARPADSPQLSLEAWPRSSAASVLVLIPTNPLLDEDAKQRAAALANRAIDGMRASRVVLDSTGEAPLRGRPHPHRQAAMAAIRQGMIDRHLRDEHWVFWADADIVEYPESLIDALISRADGGIAAPLVLMQGDPSEPLSNEFGFGPGRFYDVAGFVEHGRWARFTPPYFDQPGPVYQLDSVGTCYLLNADLYRHGARHSLDPASRAFIEADTPWPLDSISRNQTGPANCFTEHYSVCEFARRAGLPVQAFADLIAYHERA